MKLRRALAWAALLSPLAARASFLSGDALDSAANVLSWVIIFLVLAIVTGVLTVTMQGAVPTILFGVSLALFVGAGFAYMRERHRGSRQ